MCWTLIVDYNSNVNYWVSLKFRIRHWRGTRIQGGGGEEGLFWRREEDVPHDKHYLDSSIVFISYPPIFILTV